MMVRVGMGVFGLLTLAMLILTLTSDRGILEVRRKAQEYNDLQMQIESLEAENTELIEEIQTLRAEPFEIERRAREELRLVRPGEVILVLPPDTD
jgi:cell division protein FtsB